MFENKLRKISREVFGDKNLQEYFILTHKKNRREMYFVAGNNKALSFAEPKFNSFKKRVIFFLLKMNILQLFLKKIKLSEDFGDVVFIGGQIKSFDLKEKIVSSFFHVQKDKEAFIEDKKVQVGLNKRGFAPKIIQLDKKNLFSQEELFSPYLGSPTFIFDRLLEFYDDSGMKLISKTPLITHIEKTLEKNGLNCDLFNEALDIVSGVDSFLQTKIHGDFAREQCLIDDGKIYFVDWGLRNGIVTEDLVNYFRLDVKYFDRKDFNLIIKKYPNHVRKNLREYLILTELFRVCELIKILSSSKLENILKFSKNRIKNILTHSF